MWLAVVVLLKRLLSLSQAQEARMGAVQAHTDSLLAAAWCAQDVAAVLASAAGACCTGTDAQVVAGVDVVAGLQDVQTAA